MARARSPEATRIDAARRAAAAAIERHAPPSRSEAATAFARQAVALAAPATPARAQALLFAAGRLASFAERLGLELQGEALLCEAVIERFIATGCDALSPASRRTLRTNLRALQRALARHPEPRPAALPRERAKDPYSAGEIEGYLRLALAQSTLSRRMRCQALICLGAGAGIVAGELRGVRGSDVVARCAGVLVIVSGRRARAVPVLRRYQEPLLAAAGFAGERFIVGGRDPGRRNISDALCGALSADPSLARLEAGRLRSTWLGECAQAIGLQAFMSAAGIRCSQRLGDIVACLPAASEQEMLCLLGGTRRA
jgi:integrase